MAVLARTRDRHRELCVAGVAISFLWIGSLAHAVFARLMLCVHKDDNEHSSE